MMKTINSIDFSPSSSKQLDIIRISEEEEKIQDCISCVPVGYYKSW